ncbi:SEFIR domain-containing protein [Amycolatopsis magusensis]|uniref:SEFIR domain-containing protein n=1 Tax=Amycolatopsis magusensis TaxID=882444 RepID=UPI0024A9443B|nr:SEFIR domain-containing protein [Amycolatopsis magusensis]MDI5976854.1 TIR domain-containing protein [Amycolatopsis magusensis]
MSIGQQSAASGSTRDRPPRIFITYSHDDERHKTLVREFGTFLHTQVGVDVYLDQWDDDGRRDWSVWAIKQLTEADFVLVIASPAYKVRAEGRAAPAEGQGAQFEAAMLRDNITKDMPRATRRILPVVLPGRSAEEIPVFLNAHSTTRYEIGEFTLAGISDLLTAFTGVPRFAKPKRGTWPPRGTPNESSHEAPEPSPSRAAPGRVLLTDTLKPVSRGANIGFTGAEIDGLHRGNSIVYRASVFADRPRGVVEYNLGRRFRFFEAVVGVLDDAADADQTGYFQVFLDNVAQPQVETRLGKPGWIRLDVTGVLRMKLVSYRPDAVSPLQAGVLVAGGRSTNPPALGWGDPALHE